MNRLIYRNGSFQFRILSYRKFFFPCFNVVLCDCKTLLFTYSDIVVVGFQEIVENKGTAMLGGGGKSTSNAVQMWHDHVLRTLRQKHGGIVHDFVLMCSEN